MRKSILRDNDYITFFKAVLYGKIYDSLQTSIHVSYRDLCRTIRGFSKNPKHDEIFVKCEETIYNQVKKLIAIDNLNQETFDNWHKKSCDELIKSSSNILTYGQAQKWFNMTLKNLSMLDHKRIERAYEFCHVPIDNYILNSTKYKLSVAWSKLNDYNEYLNFQKWFRNEYNDIPLDEEFKMWLKEGKNINN